MKLKQALILGVASTVLALPAFAASKMPADPTTKAPTDLTQPSVTLTKPVPPKGQCLTNDSQEAKRIEEAMKGKPGKNLEAKETELLNVKPAAETDKK